MAHKFLEQGSALLFKGSQGGIYLEEAVKVVLHSTDDEEKLVRQSSAWLEKNVTFSMPSHDAYDMLNVLL